MPYEEVKIHEKKEMQGDMVEKPWQVSECEGRNILFFI